MSLAGPAFGLLAMIPFVAAWAVMGHGEWLAGAFFIAMLNLVNLVPAPPLDGSKVLMSLLPGHLAYQYQKLEPYGNYILIALVLIPGLLCVVVTPFYRVIEFVIRGTAGLILGIVL